MRRPLPLLLAAAALLPGAAPASAAPVVYATAHGQRDGARSATGVCVAVAAGAVATAITECGFSGEDSGATAFATQAAAVATFKGLIGEQPKDLCWKGYVVAPGTTDPIPFSGCVVVS